MRLFVLCTTLICLLLAPFFGAEAAMYKYTDESGRTVFVDDGARIPDRYRGSANQLQTAPSAPPQANADNEGAATNESSAEGEKVSTTEPAEPAEQPAMTITDRNTEQLARQQAASLDRARAYQTPVMVHGSRVMVSTEVIAGGNSAHLMLMLDDKTPTTIFYRPAVEALRFPAGEQISLPVPGNRTAKAEKVRFESINIGPFALKDFPVALLVPSGGSRSFDGILGMDFLKTHPYTVDFEREILRWKQPEN